MLNKLHYCFGCRHFDSFYRTCSFYNMPYKIAFGICSSGNGGIKPIEISRRECLEKNKFDCNDRHCFHYTSCEKDSVDAYKEEWENLQRKRKEEEKAIKEWLDNGK